MLDAALKDELEANRIDPVRYGELLAAALFADARTVDFFRKATDNSAQSRVAAWLSLGDPP